MIKLIRRDYIEICQKGMLNSEAIIEIEIEQSLFFNIIKFKKVYRKVHGIVFRYYNNGRYKKINYLDARILNDYFKIPLDEEILE